MKRAMVFLAAAAVAVSASAANAANLTRERMASSGEVYASAVEAVRAVSSGAVTETNSAPTRFVRAGDLEVRVTRLRGGWTRVVVLADDVGRAREVMSRIEGAERR